MHAEMILILFATLVISQFALIKWRQMYPYSYHVSTCNITLLSAIKVNKSRCTFHETPPLFLL